VFVFVSYDDNLSVHFFLYRYRFEPYNVTSYHFLLLDFCTFSTIYCCQSVVHSIIFLIDITVIKCWLVNRNLSLVTQEVTVSMVYMILP